MSCTKQIREFPPPSQARRLMARSRCTQGSKQIFVRSAPDKNTLFKGLALACAPMGFLVPGT